MTIKTSQFDIAKHLKTDEDIQGFLQEVIDTGNTSDLLHALSIAAKAKGMTEVAKEIGVSRTSLYKSLAEDGNPSFDTINKVVHTLGCKFKLEAA